MAKNRMSDLRDHLFETIEALKDTEKPMDIDRAKAICHVAQKLIDSAKVEVDLVKAIGAERSGEFFEVTSPRPPLNAAERLRLNGPAAGSKAQ